MHVVLWAEESEAELRAELTGTIAPVSEQPGQRACLETNFALAADAKSRCLVFARQLLPNAERLQAESVRSWANLIFERCLSGLPEGKPWALHIAPHYGPTPAHRIGARAWHTAGRWGSTQRGLKAGTGSRTAAPSKQLISSPAFLAGDAPDPDAGRHRCDLIREALVELMRRKRRHLLRSLRSTPAPFTAEDSLVQVLLTAPDQGYLSVALAPLPHVQRHLISSFPKGMVPIGSDKDAPSRAFTKLIEAEQRFGKRIGPGETCVDLGAAPGSWTYVAVGRGARVIAVDRAGLREDLMQHPAVKFQSGDAFQFKPSQPVDWLLCDVIAEPERTADLLLKWLRHGWCRQFMVTLKLRDLGWEKVLNRLKQELPQLTEEFVLTRLCANKKEVCAFGTGGSKRSPHKTS